jgi:lysophospholipase L1-like esterase
VRRAGAIATVVGLVLAGGVATRAQSPAGLGLEALADETGWVSLRATAKAGSVVTVRELIGDGSVRVARFRAQADTTTRPRVVAWRCDRRVRRFLVYGTGPDGRGGTARARVTTPSCAGRLDVGVEPRRPRVRERLTVTLTDRWGTGDLGARVCLRRTCGRVALARGQKQGAVRLRARRSGRAPLAVTIPGTAPIRRDLTIRGVPGPLTVLATGDSMIQNVDLSLQRHLARPGRRVVSDAHVSSAISRPGSLDWPRHARRTAARIQPDATVVFLGANEGFAIGRANCCGDAWVRAYAARVRRVMRAYGGRVYWLALPTPRPDNFQRLFAAVNVAIRRAARGLPHVRVVDAAVPARHRQDDGVHLDMTGADLVARQVIRAIRRDGLL